MVDTRLVEDHGREPDLLMLDSRFVSRGPDFGGDIGNNEFIKVDEPSNTVYPLRSVDRGESVVFSRTATTLRFCGE